MDAELKKKWVEALRSGEYKQYEGALKEGFSFCCLGVLAAVKNGGTTEEHIYGNDKLDSGYDIIARECGHVIKDKLTGMNDGGQSFPAIADWIEANL
jgi:hypothetical protein